MGLARADDGWAITFAYVSEIDVQSEDAIRLEAKELFEDHFRKIADTTDPKIIGAILYAANEPFIMDGRVRTRVRYATVFMRQTGGGWRMHIPEE